MGFCEAVPLEFLICRSDDVCRCETDPSKTPCRYNIATLRNTYYYTGGQCREGKRYCSTRLSTTTIFWGGIEANEWM